MEYNIDELVNSLDFKSNSLKDCGNGIFLTNFEISVLNRYNIDYSKYNDLKGIIFEIEEILNYEVSYEDLEKVSKTISERDYYQNTNK